MKLTTSDDVKIQYLKKHFGFTQTSELIRFILIREAERVLAERNQRRDWRPLLWETADQPTIKKDVLQ
jgi:hypothetical protein